jgi:hypothetical protein
MFTCGDNGDIILRTEDVFNIIFLAILQLYFLQYFTVVLYNTERYCEPGRIINLLKRGYFKGIKKCGLLNVPFCYT